MKFFINKTVNIRDQIYNLLPTMPETVSLSLFLSIFVNEPQLYPTLSHLRADLIPSKPFYKILPISGSVILDLVSALLLTGYVRRAFTIVVIKPVR